MTAYLDLSVSRDTHTAAHNAQNWPQTSRQTFCFVSLPCILLFKSSNIYISYIDPIVLINRKVSFSTQGTILPFKCN